MIFRKCRYLTITTRNFFLDAVDRMLVLVLIDNSCKVNNLKLVAVKAQKEPGDPVSSGIDSVSCGCPTFSASGSFKQYIGYSLELHGDNRERGHGQSASGHLYCT